MLAMDERVKAPLDHMLHFLQAKVPEWRTATGKSTCSLQVTEKAEQIYTEYRTLLDLHATI